jgi:hypothetical protein
MTKKMTNDQSPNDKEPLMYYSSFVFCHSFVIGYLVIRHFTSHPPQPSPLIDVYHCL